jgi:hypothetical protein
MREELEKKFYDEFPGWFDECQFGFEVLDGWFDLLWNMCIELKKLDFNQGFAQIKEKFGTLRVYANGATEEQWTIIEKAEEESETTCEECGAKGKLRGNSWLYTRCDECWNEILEKYK